tara:strand:+ start:346 stop:759 length:414 start_codon:yes stop_codon:yes gene_type:complete
MASILKVDTITGVATAGSIAITGEGNSTTTNLQQGLAKVWTSFEMQGTAATFDSFAHSSLTDNGTGDVTLTSSAVMANALYANIGMAGLDGNSLDSISQCYGQTVPTTTAARYVIAYANTSLSDTKNSGVARLGDLA